MTVVSRASWRREGGKFEKVLFFLLLCLAANHTSKSEGGEAKKEKSFGRVWKTSFPSGQKKNTQRRKKFWSIFFFFQHRFSHIWEQEICGLGKGGKRKEGKMTVMVDFCFLIWGRKRKGGWLINILCLFPIVGFHFLQTHPGLPENVKRKINLQKRRKLFTAIPCMRFSRAGEFSRTF